MNVQRINFALNSFFEFIFFISLSPRTGLMLFVLGIAARRSCVCIRDHTARHLSHVLHPRAISGRCRPCSLFPPAAPPRVYIESKGMGLVWPAYLNTAATELRSSIPVHITQGSDKPPQGTWRAGELGGRGAGLWKYDKIR